MAMNKAEKAQLEDALTKAALRFTTKVKRDVLPPSGDNEISIGYDFNKNNLEVRKMWSSSVFHGTYPKKSSSSQNPIALYSTVLNALMAMRNEIENDCSKKLREIDIKIEEYIQEEIRNDKSSIGA